MAFGEVGIPGRAPPHQKPSPFKSPFRAVSSGHAAVFPPQQKRTQASEGSGDDDDDGSFLEEDSAPRRQYTDSVLQSVGLREALESQIAQLLKAHLVSGPSLDAPPGLQPLATQLEEACGSGSEGETAAGSEDRLGAKDREAVMAGQTGAAPFGDRTTVMIRHVPPKLTQRQLMREVGELGFSGKFDFLFIPMDSRRRSNRGMAFINFCSPALASDFALQVHGKQLKHPSSQREVEVVPADVQGFERNVEQHLETLLDVAETSKPVVLRKLPEHFAKRASTAQVDSPAAAGARKTGVQKGWDAPVQPPAPSMSGRRGSAASPVVPAPVGAAWRGPGPRMGVANFCAFCGIRRGVGFLFCPSCGTRFVDSPVA